MKDKNKKGIKQEKGVSPTKKTEDEKKKKEKRGLIGLPPELLH